MRRRLRLCGTLFLLALASTPAYAQVPDCNSISMTVSASVSTDPGFEGLYKYCVAGSWDVGQHAVSHIDFFLALANCECVCDPRIAKFGAPAGTSTGETDSGA